MKVLHVIPAVAPRYGGPSQAIVGMCRALQQAGIDVLIAATDADGPRRLSVESGRPVLYEGVPTIFFPRQVSEAFKYSRSLARWLDRSVMGFNVAHIHAVFSHSSLAAACACQRHGVPYVVRPLGSLDPWSLKQKRIAKLLLWHLGVKQMLRRAAALHYTTQAERRLAEGSLGLKGGIVVPLGVDGSLLRPPPPRESFRGLFPSLGKDPFVVVLSRLHPKKGLELFLDVFLEVIRAEEFKHWRLVVAGQGEADYVASLKRLVEGSGGNGRVLFTGWLEGDRKFSALREAALLALTSYQENFGLSVLEGLACGIPALLSSHVNLAEEVEAAGAGWVVELEREALFSALRRALRENQERARRGALGREFAHRFDWSQISVELVELYRSIGDMKFGGTHAPS